MALPAPLTVVEWTYLAQALKIPLQASGTSMISVLNSWQNLTSMKIASSNDPTQNAWNQMVSYAQALETDQVTLLQDVLTKWASLAYCDQVVMDNGAVDGAVSGVSYSTVSQLATYVQLIKAFIPIYQPGENVGFAPVKPPDGPRNISFSTGR